MPGHATLGQKRYQLPYGEHLCQIVDVELGEQTDFNDRTKKKPAFIWNIDVWLDEAVEGFQKGWNSQKLWTPTAFTDMNREPKPKPQFVSSLNKLVRACGQPVPQTESAVEEWDESTLCGLQFVLKIEEDEETGGRTRKFLRVAAREAKPETETKTPKPPAARTGARPAPPPAPPADDDDDVFADE